LASFKKEITEQSASSSGIPTGTFAWMAPDLFDIDGKNTKESDIYSFGIVCSEMTVHRLPWKGSSSMYN